MIVATNQSLPLKPAKVLRIHGCESEARLSASAVRNLSEEKEIVRTSLNDAFNVRSSDSQQP